MNKNNTTTIGEKCIEIYPDRIPIIIHYEKNNSSTSNFLVPADATVGHLLINIRRNAKISYSDNLWVYVNNKMVVTTDLLSQLYTNNKDKTDNCLHVTIKKNNTFVN